MFQHDCSRAKSRHGAGRTQKSFSLVFSYPYGTRDHANCLSHSRDFLLDPLNSALESQSFDAVGCPDQTFPFSEMVTISDYGSLPEAAGRVVSRSRRAATVRFIVSASAILGTLAVVTIMGQRNNQGEFSRLILEP